MIEDIKLSETILKIIADDESYPARMDIHKIRDSDALKENFKNISEGKIVFHLHMLKEEGLIDAKFLNKKFLDGTAAHLIYINRLTKKGSDYVKYIESPIWKRAIKDLENAKKPLTIQLIYSVCEKLIKKQ